MTALPRRFARFVAEVAKAQHRDQLIVRTAALAYTTLLSLVPLLTVALVTVSRINPERAEEVVRSIANILPFSTARVKATLAMFAERTAALGGLSVAISALVSLHAFYQIEEVINTIWGVPHRRQWQWRLASFVMVLVWGPLLLTALFSILFWIYKQPWAAKVTILTQPLPALFAFAALTALYRWVPHTRVPWRAALTGAIVATIALAGIHIGFQAYLTVAYRLNVIYGSLTLVLFFLISLFFFWLAVLLGAEASWVMGHVRVPRPQARADVVLNLLVETLVEGNLSPGRAATLLGEDCAGLLGRMEKPPEILVRTREGWRLARNPDAITVIEVRQRVGAAAGSDPWPDEATLAVVAKAMERSGSGSAPPVPSEQPRH